MPFLLYVICCVFHVSCFMFKLQEQINNDLKQAMRGRQEQKVSVLRMLISSIRNKEIELRSAGKDELTGEQVVKILRSEVKKRKDSISAYEQGGRQDLAQKEKDEIIILQEYLPAELSDAEIEKIVKEIMKNCEGASMKDFGRIMGQAMAKVGGRADGNRVGGKIKELLR